MSLLLEIEYLSGVSFAAVGPDNSTPDWPPQPDRIFSALVASWAARGEDGREREALEWLEKLPVPELFASDTHLRTAATTFVPPNDPRSNKQKNAKGVLPILRSRKPRRFPAARPHDRTVHLRWMNTEPDEATLSALQALARDTAYVGHSASLTRCRFLLEPNPTSLGNARPPRRRVYLGRFAELRQAFDAGRRPLAGARVTPARTMVTPRANSFGEDWLILEHVDGEMPDIRSCAVVAKALRRTLLSGYRQIGLEREIPEVISGHTADGSATRAIHLAIVPLTFVGFPYADGHVMGFALVPPRDSAILRNETFRRALRLLAPIDEELGRRVLTVTIKSVTSTKAVSSIGLSPTFEAPTGRRSLDPGRYTQSARIFATVTPIALDRHLKEKGAAREAEIAAQIANACQNIGLPEPELVVADKHSAVEAAPSAYPSRRSPGWMRWRLPQSLASRQLTHAVIRFPSKVDGPVVLGAGRFLGLGLCSPLDTEAQ